MNGSHRAFALAGNFCQRVALVGEQLLHQPVVETRTRAACSSSWHDSISWEPRSRGVELLSAIREVAVGERKYDLGSARRQFQINRFLKNYEKDFEEQCKPISGQHFWRSTQPASQKTHRSGTCTQTPNTPRSNRFPHFSEVARGFREDLPEKPE